MGEAGGAPRSRWKQRWEAARESGSLEEAYKWCLRVLWVLPLLSAVIVGLGWGFHWGLGWGLALGGLAAVLYFGIAGDPGWGEMRWFIWQWGLLLILGQEYYLMWMAKELAHAYAGGR